MNAEDLIAPTTEEIICHACRHSVKNRCCACRQGLEDRPSPFARTASTHAPISLQPTVQTPETTRSTQRSDGPAVTDFSARATPPEIMNDHPNPPPTAPVDETNFETLSLKAKLPILVAFHAPWSRPCQILNRSLDEVVPACAGRATIIRINADDHPYLSLWYAIQSIPTLLFFVDGHIRAKIVGAVGRETILSQLQSLVPGGVSKPLPGGARKGSNPPECDDW